MWHHTRHTRRGEPRWLYLSRRCFGEIATALESVRGNVPAVRFLRCAHQPVQQQERLALPALRVVPSRL